MSLGGKKRIENIERTETTGEVIFDRAVYTGIGFGVNELLSMIIAVEARHFGGKKYFDKWSEGFAQAFKMKDKVKKGVTKSAVEEAGDILEIGALLTGGTLLVWPMKWLEDRKAGIVKKLNHMTDKFGGHTLDAEGVAARDAEVEKAIACEAKQTWGSMLAGRGLAVISNMGIIKNTIMAGDRTDWSKRVSEDWSRKAVSKTNKIIGGDESSKLGRMMKTERFKRYSEILGLETFYTAASSIVLEVSSKFIASKKPKVKSPELCEQAFREAVDERIEKREQLAAANAPQPAGKKFTDSIKPANITAPAQAGLESHVQKLASEPESQLQQGL